MVSKLLRWSAGCFSRNIKKYIEGVKIVEAAIHPPVETGGLLAANSIKPIYFKE